MLIGLIPAGAGKKQRRPAFRDSTRLIPAGAGKGKRLTNRLCLRYRMIPAYAGTISPFTTQPEVYEPSPTPSQSSGQTSPGLYLPKNGTPPKKSPNPPETAENANAGKGVTDTAGDGAGHEPSHSLTSAKAPITPNAVPASKTHKTNPAANLNSEDFRPKLRASTSVPLSGCPCAGDPRPSPFAFRRIRPVPRSIIRRTAPRPPQPPSAGIGNQEHQSGNQPQSKTNAETDEPVYDERTRSAA